ncbi:ribosomal RNA small subunit methyltransferase G [Phocicoccus schoeneichii]|uniref:Ribosomal RNA small subunit methyltransferase G n=1 Tax=Phocicoccus schoeneichii TaxID=1812261 RepID=A0A6V7R9U1_9BACL|nr:16S rRNA (guanine(527)-N(7))-methyltransferase RsmG [Jeotgalicoccus schoeneichii]GGH52891.1 ribosomal RNA small subunit methyltransferase G [Jeotgalicoccus schoeneichii]CAD2074229.1 Ribosomal RNA small subunit methyltransferase G [Jeotgalicoccus schoeneichii]
MTKDEFILHLKKEGIEVTDIQMKQFDMYFKMLVEWNEKINLTAVTEENEVYEKHFYDSITPLFYADIEEGASLCDVGAGAGFPSIPMKILRPDLKVTIVDSLNKRIMFLNELTANLELDKITLVHDRAETFGQHTARHMFDVVTARAVARLNVLAELCLPLVRTGGKFIVLKGKRTMEEIDEAEFALKLLGGKLEAVHELSLPEEESDRYILEIKKTSKTPRKYPRKPGTPSKKPLLN